MNEQKLSVCPGGLFTRKYAPSLCLWAGLLTGGSIALLSGVIGLLPTGHQFNDPVMLTVSINSLLRGFIYFNWRSFIIALIFSLSLGILSWIVLKILARRFGKVVFTDGADKAAKSAVFFSSLPVLIQEIDAVRIILFYGISVWLSMFLAGLIARQLVKIIK